MLVNRGEEYGKGYRACWLNHESYQFKKSYDAIKNLIAMGVDYPVEAYVHEAIEMVKQLEGTEYECQHCFNVSQVWCPEFCPNCGEPVEEIYKENDVIWQPN